MRIVRAESIVRATRVGFIFFLLFFSMGLIHGCRPISEVKERSKRAVRDLSFSKAGLKKKVGLSLFSNRTFITDNTVEMMFQKHLSESLKKRCPDLILITSGHDRFPEILTSTPKTGSGEIDNFALAEAAKRSGLNAVVTGQLGSSLAGIEDLSRLIIAYEPIWAIGTGRAATGERANEIIGLIRHHIARQYGISIARDLRIIYGGSVTADNTTEFMRQPEIDGALVGGASLKANQFLSIVKQTAEVKGG